MTAFGCLVVLPGRHLYQFNLIKQLSNNSKEMSYGSECLALL